MANATLRIPSEHLVSVTEGAMFVRSERADGDAYLDARESAVGELVEQLRRAPAHGDVPLRVDPIALRCALEAALVMAGDQVDELTEAEVLELDELHAATARGNWLAETMHALEVN